MVVQLAWGIIGCAWISQNSYLGFLNTASTSKEIIGVKIKTWVSCITVHCGSVQITNIEKERTMQALY